MTIHRVDALDLQLLCELSQRLGGPGALPFATSGAVNLCEADLAALRQLRARSVSDLVDEVEGFVETQVADLAGELTAQAGELWRSEALVRATTVVWGRLTQLLASRAWEGVMDRHGDGSALEVLASGFPALTAAAVVFDQDA